MANGQTNKQTNKWTSGQADKRTSGQEGQARKKFATIIIIMTTAIQTTTLLACFLAFSLSAVFNSITLRVSLCPSLSLSCVCVCALPNAALGYPSPVGIGSGWCHSRYIIDSLSIASQFVALCDTGECLVHSANHPLDPSGPNGTSTTRQCATMTLAIVSTLFHSLTHSLAVDLYTCFVPI